MSCGRGENEGGGKFLTKSDADGAYGAYKKIFKTRFCGYLHVEGIKVKVTMLFYLRAKLRRILIQR